MLRKDFLQTTIEKLGANSISFLQSMDEAKQSATSFFPLLSAGVILPLTFNHNNNPSETEECPYSFQLIKRSKYVSQAGDLGCPGGILHSKVDKLLRILIRYHIIPILCNRAGELAKKRGYHTYNTMLLYLANAMRESWEEIRLNPFKIKFLGPLPSYQLHKYNRIIFPFACVVSMFHKFHLNYEVERMVTVPVASFFHKENYGRLISEEDIVTHPHSEEVKSQPCLVCSDGQGREEILWGATFSIIVSFLKIACAFEMPEWQTSRVIIKKGMSINYDEIVKGGREYVLR